MGCKNVCETFPNSGKTGCHEGIKTVQNVIAICILKEYFAVCVSLGSTSQCQKQM